MRTLKALPWIVAPAVLALAYAIAVVVAAWRAPQKGFLAFTGHRVAHVEVGGIADRAGLVTGDVITAIDGAPVTSTFDYAARVLGRAPGETVTLTVRGQLVTTPTGRYGETLSTTHSGRDIRLALGASPPPWSALIATLLAGVLLALGVIARVGRPGDVLARKFYRASIVYAMVYVGALSWTHLVIHPVLAIVFLASLFAGPKLALDLALELTRAPARAWSRATNILSLVLGIACAAGLALALVDYSDGGGASSGGDRGLQIMVATIAIQCASVPLYTGIALAFQIREHRHATGARRAQLRWLIFGQALGTLPASPRFPPRPPGSGRFSSSATNRSSSRSRCCGSCRTASPCCKSGSPTSTR